jgi:hypothetical protein
MQRVFAALLAITCVVGATPSLARGAGGGFGHGGFAHGSGFAGRSGLLFAEPTPQMPQSRIPAPLAAPSPAPTINGPMSQPAFRGMTGIGQ